MDIHYENWPTVAEREEVVASLLGQLLPFSPIGPIAIRQQARARAIKSRCVAPKSLLRCSRASRAALGTGNLTLADLAKRLDPSGNVATVVELLNQSNEMLDDMVWREGNLPTGDVPTLQPHQDHRWPRWPWKRLLNAWIYDCWSAQGETVRRQQGWVWIWERPSESQIRNQIDRLVRALLPMSRS